MKLSNLVPPGRSHLLGLQNSTPTRRLSIQNMSPWETCQTHTKPTLLLCVFFLDWAVRVHPLNPSLWGLLNQPILNSTLPCPAFLVEILGRALVYSFFWYLWVTWQTPVQLLWPCKACSDSSLGPGSTTNFFFSRYFPFLPVATSTLPCFIPCMNSQSNNYFNPLFKKNT